MLKNKSDNAIIYAEVNAILNMMPQEEVNKLPKKLLEIIKKEKSNTYIPNYDSKIELSNQNIKKETLAMLALLYINYWCKNENEKKEYLKLIEENEQKYQKELKKKTDIETLLKNEKHKDIEEQSLTIVENKNFIQKIIDKIKKLWKKNK